MSSCLKPGAKIFSGLQYFFAVVMEFHHGMVDLMKEMETKSIFLRISNLVSKIEIVGEKLNQTLVFYFFQLKAELSGNLTNRCKPAFLKIPGLVQWITGCPLDPPS